MPHSSETSRVLTLVFTDLADSTALKSAHGDVAVGELIARHRDLVVRLAEECAGRVIDWAGDGCFLTFETSSAGVVFALRLQQAHAVDAELPGVRVGLHMGEVTEKEGLLGQDGPPRIEGLAVDLAARIQGLAWPGQVLMSSPVYQSARQRLGVEAFGAPILWQAYGDYAIKGFDDPLDICEAGLEGMSPLVAPEASEKAQPLIPYRGDVKSPYIDILPLDAPTPMRRYGLIAFFFVAVSGVTLGTDFIARTLTGTTPTRLAAPGPIRSLAVLPLDNHSNEAEQQYFADGMTEAITAELAKIKSLKVISRTSAQRYRGSTLSGPEIAAELNVDGLIEGSVLREGDVVRITVQLIDAHTDAHVWSEEYEDTVTSVLKLQSKVALAIADTLRAELTPDERERIADAPEVNPEAYNVYLQAVDAMSDITPTGMFRVRQLFTQAASLDAEFADAWGGVALSNVILGAYAAGPPRPFVEAAKEAADRALNLDRTLGEAHAVRGLTDVYLGLNWESARSRFEIAEQLNPNSFFVTYLHGAFSMTTGNWPNVEYEANRILDLNPYASFPVCIAAVFLTNTGHAQQGIQILEGEVAKDSRNIQASLYLGWGRLLDGEYDAAIAEFERTQSITGPIPVLPGMIAYSHALAGREDEARALLEQLTKTTSPDVLAIGPLPWAYYALGDTDAAFEWFERGAETPAGLYLDSLRNVPFTDEWLRHAALASMAEEPRYWRLIERLGFPPLPPEHPGYAYERTWRESNQSADAQQ